MVPLLFREVGLAVEERGPTIAEMTKLTERATIEKTRNERCKRCKLGTRI
jgi:hypothetical protein